MAKSISCILFHFLKTELKAERPTNKQQLKSVAVKAWQSITNQETQSLVMTMSSRLKAVIACKGFSTKYKKHFIMIIYICPITFEPLKIEGLCIEMVVISKHFVIFFQPLELKLKICTSINLDCLIIFWCHTEPNYEKVSKYMDLTVNWCKNWICHVLISLKHCD